VCFGFVNGRYEKSDGRDFIVVSLHPGRKFSKKKTKHFIILTSKPKVLLYIYPNVIYNMIPATLIFFVRCSGYND
jgi:hypothetical protein